uniref:Secreted protein n=2 Tax=Phytophthora fragariae TaxID=53985 RepID=A0A6A3D913_9STRA|nr:hypothetical protein PF009_g32203 [Phytophthora fragariae]
MPLCSPASSRRCTSLLFCCAAAMSSSVSCRVCIPVRCATLSLLAFVGRMSASCPEVSTPSPPRIGPTRRCSSWPSPRGTAAVCFVLGVLP